MRQTFLPGEAVFLVAAVLFFAVISGCSTTAPDPMVENWQLSVNGTTEKVLTMNDLKALPAVNGHGYCVSTTGARFGPYTCNGVDLRNIAALVGGVGSGQQVWVSAPDGYLWVFDLDQLNGEGFVTFNENLTEIPSPPLHIILMYEQDGKPLSYDDGGPARIAIVSEQPGVITEGSAWVKWVDRIEIRD
ncbi:MAG: molybdopterin-dependent oxidoreductase [Methanoregulaceae archaeon]|jgi:DMSO/TMAO reductase YedYZ molybdopterin-dependent catalytic subunit|nr:molybdopterin-dependent oxidoreductase [Methanoregulaceae archaeon]